MTNLPKETSRCEEVFAPDDRSEGFRYLLEHGFVPARWVDGKADRENAFVHILKRPSRQAPRVSVYVSLYGDTWLAWYRWYENRGRRTCEAISRDFTGKTPCEALEKMLDELGIKEE